jgi:hypothetical protein
MPKVLAGEIHGADLSGAFQFLSALRHDLEGTNAERYRFLVSGRQSWFQQSLKDVTAVSFRSI